MTVAELIALLQTMPQELPVTVRYPPSPVLFLPLDPADVRVAKTGGYFPDPEWDANAQLVNNTPVIRPHVRIG